MNRWRINILSLSLLVFYSPISAPLVFSLTATNSVAWADEKKKPDDEVESHAGKSRTQAADLGGEPELPGAEGFMDERALKTMTTAEEALKALDQLNNQSATTLFLRAAPQLIEDLNELAKFYEQNGQKEKAQALRARAEDLKSKMEEQPKPQDLEAQSSQNGGASTPGNSTQAPSSGSSTAGAAAPQLAPSSKGNGASSRPYNPDDPKNPARQSATEFEKKYGITLQRLLRDPKHGDPSIGEGPRESKDSSPKTQAVRDRWREQIESGSLSDRDLEMLANAWLITGGKEIQEKLKEMGASSEDAAEFLRFNPSDPSSGIRKIGLLEDPDLLALSFSEPKNIPIDAWKNTGVPAEIVTGLAKSDDLTQTERMELKKRVEDYLTRTKPPSADAKAPLTDQAVASVAAREALAKFVLSEEKRNAETLIEKANGIDPQERREILSPLKVGGTQLAKLTSPAGVSAMGPHETTLHGMREAREQAIAQAKSNGAPIEGILRSIEEKVGLSIPPNLIPSIVEHLDKNDQNALQSVLENGHSRNREEADLQRELAGLVLNPANLNLLLQQMDLGLAQQIAQQKELSTQAQAAAQNGDVEGFKTAIGKLTKAYEERLEKVPEKDRAELKRKFEETRTALLREALVGRANHLLDKSPSVSQDELKKDPVIQALAKDLGLDQQTLIKQLDRERQTNAAAPAVAAAEQARQLKVALLHKEYQAEIAAAQTDEEKAAIRRKYDPKFKEYNDIGPSAREEERLAAERAREAATAAAAARQSVDGPMAEARAQLEERRKINDERLRALGEMEQDSRNLRAPAFYERLFGINVETGPDGLLRVKEDLRDKTHLDWYFRTETDGSVVWNIAGRKAQLLEEQRVLGNLLRDPSSHPAFAIFNSGQDRKDLPVTRTRVERVWDGSEMNPQLVDEVITEQKNNGTYDEWKKQQDPGVIAYLESERASRDPKTQTKLATAEAAEKRAASEYEVVAKRNQNSQQKLTEEFWRDAGAPLGTDLTPTELASRAARINQAMSDAQDYVAASIPLGSSISPDQREFAARALNERREQVLDGLVASGLPREMAEGFVEELMKNRGSQVATLDREFRDKRQAAEKAGLEVQAYTVIPKNSNSSIQATFEHTKALQETSGKGYASTLLDSVLTAQYLGGVFQLTPKVSIEITSPEQLMRGLSSGKLEGVQYASTTALQEKFQPLVNDMAAIEKRQRERAARPSTYSAETREEERRDLEKKHEVATALRGAGNLVLQLPGAGPVNAASLRGIILERLGNEDFKISFENVVASRRQENGLIGTTIKTGVAVAAIPFTFGTSAAALVVGGAAWATVGTVGGAVLAHNYQQALGMNPYMDFYNLNQMIDRAAIQGASTAGLGRFLSAAGASQRVASLGSVVGAGTIISGAYGDTLDQALFNMASQYAFQRTGPEFLRSTVGSTRSGIVTAQAYLSNLIPSLGVDSVRTALNGGTYVSITGQQVSIQKDGFSKWVGTVIADNLFGDLMSTARSGKIIRQKMDSRLGYQISQNPELATRLSQTPKGQETLSRALGTLSPGELVRLTGDPSLKPFAADALTGRSLAEINRATQDSQSPNGVLGFLRRVWSGAPPPSPTARLPLDSVTPQTRQLMAQRAFQDLNRVHGENSPKTVEVMKRLGFENADIDRARKALAPEATPRNTNDGSLSVSETVTRGIRGIKDRVSSFFQGRASQNPARAAPHAKDQASPAGTPKVGQEAAENIQSKYASLLSLAMRKLDDASTLPEIIKRLNKANPKDIPELLKFLERDLAIWPNHGEYHGREIASAILKAVDDFDAQGHLSNFSPKELAALRSLGVVMGLTHDAGNFTTDGRAREFHDLVPMILAWGGKIPGLETEGATFQRALDDLARDKSNPLTKLLYEVAGEKAIQERYAGSADQIVRTLLGEMVTGSLSHGRLPGNPSLGLDSLAARRGAYLEQTRQGYPTSFGEDGKPRSMTEPLEVGNRYQGGNRNNFMAWANPEVTRNLEPTSPVFSLQRAFSASESLLNYADANRARQAGLLRGPNEVQLFPAKTPGGDVRVYAVIPGANGKKVVTEVPGGRAIGSLNVIPFKLEGTSANPVFRGGVVDIDFAPGSKGEAKVAQQTGRVLGETYAYLVRATPDLLSGKLPEVEIALPGRPTDSFRQSLEASVRENIEKVFKRNGMDPSRVTLRFVEQTPPPRTPSAGEQALVARARPADEATLASVSRSTGLDGRFFEGAGVVDLKPGEQFIKFGDQPEFVAVVVGGKIKGSTPEANGGRQFEAQATEGSMPLLGGTAFLTAWGQGGTRNATLAAGEDGARLLIVPRETAAKLWTASNLESRPEIGSDGKVTFTRAPTHQSPTPKPSPAPQPDAAAVGSNDPSGPFRQFSDEQTVSARSALENALGRPLSDAELKPIMQVLLEVPAQNKSGSMDALRGKIAPLIPGLNPSAVDQVVGVASKWIIDETKKILSEVRTVEGKPIDPKRHSLFEARAILEALKGENGGDKKLVATGDQLEELAGGKKSADVVTRSRGGEYNVAEAKASTGTGGVEFNPRQMESTVSIIRSQSPNARFGSFTLFIPEGVNKVKGYDIRGDQLYSPGKGEPVKIVHEGEELGPVRVVRIKNKNIASGPQEQTPLRSPATDPTSSRGSSGKAALPQNQEERFEVTARAVRENLPGASAELIQKIQKLVEEKGHHNQSGVVKHYEATDAQLRARTQDLREGLAKLGVDSATAKKITSAVIRGGAAGEHNPFESEPSLRTLQQIATRSSESILREVMMKIPVQPEDDTPEARQKIADYLVQNGLVGDWPLYDLENKVPVIDFQRINANTVPKTVPVYFPAAWDSQKVQQFIEYAKRNGIPIGTRSNGTPFVELPSYYPFYRIQEAQGGAPSLRESEFASRQIFGTKAPPKGALSGTLPATYWTSDPLSEHAIYALQKTIFIKGTKPAGYVTTAFELMATSGRLELDQEMSVFLAAPQPSVFGQQGWFSVVGVDHGQAVSPSKDPLRKPMVGPSPFRRIMRR